MQALPDWDFMYETEYREFDYKRRKNFSCGRTASLWTGHYYDGSLILLRA